MNWKKSASDAPRVVSSGGWIVAAILAILSVSACTYGHPPPAVISGRTFPVVAARNLVRGTSGAEVQKTLGEPLRTIQRSDSTIWEYEFVTKQQESIKLLGVIPLPSRQRGGVVSATLSFVGGLLQSVTVNGG